MILPPLKDQESLSEEEQMLYYALSQCVRCAACQPTCPTFQETIDEGHSPRGRVSLIRALHEKESGTTERLNSFLYACLECRACETSCPNNVEFHKIIEFGKEKLNEADLTPVSGKFFKWLFLKKIFRRAKSLDRFMGFLRFYAKSGLQKFVRLTRLLKLFPWHLGDLEKLMPALPKKHRPLRKKTNYRLVPAGELKGEVMMFTGCIADHWLQAANHATMRLLLRAGYSVFVPSRQQCCGALHVHLGETERGRDLARANIDAFTNGRESARIPIVTNAAGCGAMLKEYGYLLRRTDDEQSGAQLADRVMDLSEILVDSRHIFADLSGNDTIVTYDDPCHLLHGQGISAPPRLLIQSISGICFVELEEADWCCGSAGVYNIVNYGMSMRLLQRKLEHIRATGAAILLTANPGCYLQLRYGVEKLKLPMKVLHLAEFLDSQFTSDPELSESSDSPPWE